MAAWNRKGSAGTEVNLRIDYEKRVARPEGHGHPAYYWLASGPQRARAGDRHRDHAVAGDAGGGTLAGKCLRRSMDVENGME